MNDILTARRSPILSSKHYDWIKWFAQYVLPGLGTLYFALSMIWGLPYAEKIVGTLVALDVFLGLLLGYSSRRYYQSDDRYDGALVVDHSNPAKDVYAIEVDRPFEDLANMDELILRVKEPPAKGSGEILGISQ